MATLSYSWDHRLTWMRLIPQESWRLVCHIFAVATCVALLLSPRTGSPSCPATGRSLILLPSDKAWHLPRQDTPFLRGWVRWVGPESALVCWYGQPGNWQDSSLFLFGLGTANRARGSRNGPWGAIAHRRSADHLATQGDCYQKQLAANADQSSASGNPTVRASGELSVHSGFPHCWLKSRMISSLRKIASRAALETPLSSTSGKLVAGRFGTSLRSLAEIPAAAMTALMLLLGPRSVSAFQLQLGDLQSFGPCGCCLCGGSGWPLTCHNGRHTPRVKAYRCGSTFKQRISSSSFL